ncbi:RNA recognition motif-containing protein [Acarospora aff. strigata]|nr:RNA recognition motif-containing protein [Acarospora aff. strigata]
MASQRKRQRMSSNGASIATEPTDPIVDGSSDSEAKLGVTSGGSQQGQRSLFVRSLPSTVTTETLTEYFSQFFPIKHATVVLDPTTQQSKGYGFVTFADPEDAKQAEIDLNGKVLENKKIKVEIAKPRQRRTDENDVHGTGKAGLSPSPAALAKAERDEKRAQAQKPPKLIVRNLPWSVKEPNQLAMLFRSYGKIKQVTLPAKRDGLSAGFGFVVMRGRKNAEKAMHAVTGKQIDGRTIAVDWAVEKEVWQDLRNADVIGAVENTEARKNTESDEHGSLKPKAMTQSEPEDEDWSDAASGEMDLSRNLGSRLEDTRLQRADDTSTTLFVRNLPFTTTDETLHAHFDRFGSVRYARAVIDHATERPKGTGFVCFYNKEDVDSCLRQAPARAQSGPVRKGESNAPLTQHSVLEDTNADPSGRYTMEGRVLKISRAVGREEATKLTEEGSSLRDKRDRDKRRLYLLSEGTVPSNSPLYAKLAPSEVKMREASAKQRQALVKSNPALHISLTRLSVRNIPRGITSKDLKALAREAVVGFAKDVKCGARSQLSKEEQERGGVEMREAEKIRKGKGKGIVKQAKIVFEGREGSKVTEDSGAGRSRGYGFVEYVSHRWALMGLRWLNGHAVDGNANDEKPKAHPRGDLAERKKRLIVEFAIENAQVVGRRQEREAKARERSKLIVGKIEDGTLVRADNKTLGRDSLMARTRKGGKRKRGEDPENGVAKPSKRKRASVNGDSGDAQPIEAKTLARRQQIIAKKRMMRRSKRKSLQA